MSLILKQILALRVSDIIVRRSNPQIRDSLPARTPKIDRETPDWNLWIPVTPNPKPQESGVDHFRNQAEQLFDSRLEEERIFERDFENSDYPFHDFNYGP